MLIVPPKMKRPSPRASVCTSIVNHQISLTYKTVPQGEFREMTLWSAYTVTHRSHLSLFILLISDGDCTEVFARVHSHRNMSQVLCDHGRCQPPCTFLPRKIIKALTDILPRHGKTQVWTSGLKKPIHRSSYKRRWSWLIIKSFLYPLKPRLLALLSCTTQPRIRRIWRCLPYRRETRPGQYGRPWLQSHMKLREDERDQCPLLGTDFGALQEISRCHLLWGGSGKGYLLIQGYVQVQSLNDGDTERQR